MSQVLQAQVDGQRKGLARFGILGDLHVLDHAATAILEHLALARHAGQPFVESQLDTFATAVVDIGKADRMGHHFASRVETPKLLDGVHAGHLQGDHAFALLRGQPTDQIDELALGVLLDAVGEQLGILPERRRQLRPAFLGGHQLLGVGPQGGDRGAHRQRFAVAVSDQAPVRRDGYMPHATRVALALEEVMVDHVQVDDSPDDGADHRQQQADDHAEPPWVEGALEIIQFHGATILTSAGSGTRMRNCSTARLSMRLWAVQVLCSRINRPHSACALSRTLSSEYSELSSCRFQ